MPLAPPLALTAPITPPLVPAARPAVAACRRANTKAGAALVATPTLVLALGTPIPALDFLLVLGLIAQLKIPIHACPIVARLSPPPEPKCFTAPSSPAAVDTAGAVTAISQSDKPMFASSTSPPVAGTSRAAASAISIDILDAANFVVDNDVYHLIPTSHLAESEKKDFESTLDLTEVEFLHDNPLREERGMTPPPCGNRNQFEVELIGETSLSSQLPTDMISDHPGINTRSTRPADLPLAESAPPRKRRRVDISTLAYQ
ncbi:hypothetical protein BDV93DRAFT_561938 [Ceratobasidium sp. AG-I]|nr:hypothetical protein BDV93DRAFT_561938 [Ceratobasidium sp. AG-I]